MIEASIKLNVMRRLPQELPQAKNVYNLKDFRKLTPPQRIGLAPVEVCITKLGQPLGVSIPVAILANAMENEQAILEAYLAEFNIDAGKFDAETNKRGLFLELPADNIQRVLIKDVIFRLLGVSQENRHNLFGSCNKHYKSLSTVYKEAEREIEDKRELFPFTNSGYFPDIQKYLAEIEQLSNIKAEKIFKKGFAPPMFSWTAKTISTKPFLLEEALSMILLALKGEKNAHKIADEHKRPTGLVHTLLKNENKSPLSPEMFTLVNKLVKKGE